jgi:hypothetical protein
MVDTVERLIDDSRVPSEIATSAFPRARRSQLDLTEILTGSALV